MLDFYFLLFMAWVFFLIVDSVFKSCMFTPYLRALEVCGIEVYPLFVTVHITRFNRALYEMGTRNPPLIKKWFKMGVIVTAIIIIPSIIICIVSLYQMMIFSGLEQYDSSLLVPVMPGYNIPPSHIVYYFLIFLLCTAFHEFGHALAGSREGVNLEDIGLSIFGAFAYAYVRFRAGHVSYLPLRRQIRVYCAGIWHNIVLALVAILLHWLLFFIWWPVFSTGNGVTVLNIKQESAFNQLGGFEIGDHLYKVGNCTFQNRESFRKCLGFLNENPPHGFCVSDDPVFQEKAEVHRQKCLTLPEYRTFHADSNPHKKGICLKARDVAAYRPCTNVSECAEGHLCMYPVLQKHDRFVTIHRYGKQPVLFEGPMGNILLEVEVSSFIPRLWIFSSSWPETFALLLEYIIMFSSGLVLLNVIPCYYLDGGYITDCFLHLALDGRVSNRKICEIVAWLKRIGCFILICLCSGAFKVFIFSMISNLWWNW